MKKVKLLIWMIVLMILEVSAVNYIRIFNAVPSLIFVLIICISIADEDFAAAVQAAAVGGLAYGALSVRGFYAVFLFYSLSGILVFSLKKKPVYMSPHLKAVMWCAVLTAVFESAMYIAESRMFGVYEFLAGILPSVIYNALASAVIYSLINKSVYNKHGKKKVLIP